MKFSSQEKNRIEDHPQVCVIGSSVRPVCEQLFLYEPNRVSADQLGFRFAGIFDYFCDSDTQFFVQQYSDSLDDECSRAFDNSVDSQPDLVRLTPGSELEQVSRFLESKSTECGCSFYWLLLGGFDQHTELIKLLLAKNQFILGRTIQQTVHIKSARFLKTHVPQNFWPVTETVSSYYCPPGRWILKKSCAPASSSEFHDLPTSVTNPGNHYWQEFVEGQAVSSLHFSTYHTTAQKTTKRVKGGCQLLGFTFQDTSPADGFRYRGNLFCSQLNRELGRAGQWERATGIGESIAEGHLSGFFGIDWILKDNQLWPIEVNPRPTASAELFTKPSNNPCYLTHIQHLLNLTTIGGVTNASEPISAARGIFKPPSALDHQLAGDWFEGKIIVYRKGKALKNALQKFRNELLGKYYSGLETKGNLRDRNRKDCLEDLFTMEVPLSQIVEGFQTGWLEPTGGSPEIKRLLQHFRVRFRDIPVPGAEILDGEPICSVLVSYSPENQSGFGNNSGYEQVFLGDFGSGKDRWTLFQAISEQFEKKINALLGEV